MFPRIRSSQQALLPVAKPRSGVDDIKAAFPQSRDIPGVVDRNTAGKPPAGNAPGAGASPSR